MANDEKVRDQGTPDESNEGAEIEELDDKALEEVPGGAGSTGNNFNCGCGGGD